MPLTTVSPGLLDSTAQYYGFKNRIINGGMVIDQRNNGASVTPTTSAYFVDRWIAICTQSSKFSVQQNAGSVTPPAGFTKYIGFTSLSAYSVSATDYFSLTQRIEGFNIADLAWGTASAAPVTLSFWVRSSLTGTFGGALYNSAGNRSYPFSYTISAANTWEQKSVTVPGDTTGTWLTDNSIGLHVSLALGVGATYSGTAGAWAGSFYTSATGATSVVGTNGATFYITGVQLEKGTVATSFDFRPYGTELQLCQRYYQRFAVNAYSFPLGAVGYCYGSSTAAMSHVLPVALRSTPAISFSDLVLRGGRFDGVNAEVVVSSFSTVGFSSGNVVTYTVTTATSPLVLGSIACLSNGATLSSSFVAYSSEL